MHFCGRARALYPLYPALDPDPRAVLGIRYSVLICPWRLSQCHTGHRTSRRCCPCRKTHIDGAENPLATLYGRSLQEVAKYLILDGHVLNFTTLVCSADWYNSLTPEQQTALTETCKAAAEYNNGLVKDADGDYLQKMKDAGVTVVHGVHRLGGQGVAGAVHPVGGDDVQALLLQG